MARATVFNLDPAAQARAFAAQGFEYLHVVDLDGAFAGKPMNAQAVEAMLAAITMAGAARRRHPGPCHHRGLAHQGGCAGDHRHRGGARSRAGEGCGKKIPGPRRGRS